MPDQDEAIYGLGSDSPTGRAHEIVLAARGRLSEARAAAHGDLQAGPSATPSLIAFWAARQAHAQAVRHWRNRLVVATGARLYDGVGPNPVGIAQAPALDIAPLALTVDPATLRPVGVTSRSVHAAGGEVLAPVATLVNGMSVAFLGGEVDALLFWRDEGSSEPEALSRAHPSLTRDLQRFGRAWRSAIISAQQAPLASQAGAAAIADETAASVLGVGRIHLGTRTR